MENKKQRTNCVSTQKGESCLNTLKKAPSQEKSFQNKFLHNTNRTTDDKLALNYQVKN